MPLQKTGLCPLQDGLVGIPAAIDDGRRRLRRRCDIRRAGGPADVRRLSRTLKPAPDFIYATGKLSTASAPI